MTLICKPVFQGSDAKMQIVAPIDQGLLIYYPLVEQTLHEILDNHAEMLITDYVQVMPASFPDLSNFHFQSI
jgi:hypothetical protein